MTTTITGKINFYDAGITIDFYNTVANLASISGATIRTSGDKAGNKAEFKIGANAYIEDNLSIGIGDMSSKGLNMKNIKSGEKTKFSIDISTRKDADGCLQAINYAIDAVSSQRATLGAIQNRLEYAISNLSATEENLTAAESRIRDVNMADEMVKYTKNNILNQSAMAMLAQANQQPQAILSLLQ